MVLRGPLYMIPSSWITRPAFLKFQSVESYRWIEELRTHEQSAFANHLVSILKYHSIK